MLNGVNSISCILLVSSPPLTLKKALIDEDDLTLAATLISKAVDGFSNEKLKEKLITCLFFRKE